MKLWSAGTFLAVASVRNAIRNQMRRARSRRYAIGLLVAGFYLWWLGARMWFLRRHAPSPDTLDLEELLLVVMGLGTMATSWVLGGDEASLGFTEAEIQMLFPAPVSRRGLLLYKMGRSFLATVFSAALATFLFGGRLTTHPVWFFVGTWFALTTLGLHLTAASLTRAMLVEHGLSGLRRRLLTLLGLVLVVGGLGWSATRIVPPPALADLSWQTAEAWATTVLHQPPLGWLLLPVRAPIELALAQSGYAFLVALPAASLMLLLHVGWVASSTSAFEDSAVASAERRTHRREARRAGQFLAMNHARPPFRLAATGRPEVALIWKSIIAAVRLASLRLVIVLLLLGMSCAPAAAAIVTPRHTSMLAITALACVGLAGYVAMLGSQLLRVDLRLDLPRMELIRSWPLSGREVVVGEIAGPVVVLAVIEWVLLAAALVLSIGWPDQPGPETRLALALSLAITLPMLSLCGLIVQNAAVLLLPGWASIDRRASRGFDAFGQRILLLFGNLLVLFGALIPATLVATPVLLLTALVGLVALPLAALAGASVILVEAWLAVGWLGGAFDRFEIEEALRS